MSLKPKVFLTEVSEELKKVSWPARDATLRTTVVVLVVLFCLTVYLGVVDAVMARLAAALLG